MNSGFKGSRIGVHTVTISGVSIVYEITFVDDDGVTHATMRHSSSIEADPVIAEKVDALVTVLINRAASAHFTKPATSSDPLQGGTYDIATALGATSVEADEPDGTQD